jgi:hypothetical protein
VRRRISLSISTPIEVRDQTSRILGAFVESLQDMPANRLKRRVAMKIDAILFDADGVVQRPFAARRNAWPELLDGGPAGLSVRFRVGLGGLCEFFE